jgi:hypothetical protein
VARQRGPKRPSTQCLTSQFPTHPNREFFEALQGIKSGDQGNFSSHQGIRARPLFWHLFADKCDRPDRPRLCREGEEGAARRSRARSRLFVHAQARQAFPEIWSPSSSTRTNGVLASRWRRRSCRSPPGLTELHRSCGTEPPLDMLMTLQGVYEKSLGTLSPSPRRAPRWTRFGQLASSIYRSLTERLPRQHSAC